jgi:hypothetical protein
MRIVSQLGVRLGEVGDHALVSGCQ